MVVQVGWEVGRSILQTGDYREPYTAKESQGIIGGPAGSHCTMLQVGFECWPGIKDNTETRQDSLDDSFPWKLRAEWNAHTSY